MTITGFRWYVLNGTGVRFIGLMTIILCFLKLQTRALASPHPVGVQNWGESTSINSSPLHTVHKQSKQMSWQ